MTRFILPILFVASSVALFFWYIDPAYDRVQAFQMEAAQFDEALSRVRELKELRDQLLTRYNTFAGEDLEQLQTLLPDTVDNVRLALELDRMAQSHGMRIRAVAVGQEQTAQAAQGATQRTQNDATAYDSFTLSFSTESNRYENFVDFVRDVERSLRLADVEHVSFSTREEGATRYAVRLRTYWLK